LTGAVFCQPESLQSDWQKIETPHFSFYMPTQMRSQAVKGKDSILWKYTSKNLTLRIELGWYAGKPNQAVDETDYNEQKLTIDEKEGIFVTSKYKNSKSRRLLYNSAIYFLLKDETKLSFVAYCKTPEEQKVTEKIFRSIKFKT
jgi:hypothetical protein